MCPLGCFSKDTLKKKIKNPTQYATHIRNKTSDLASFLLRFKLEETIKAFETAKTGAGGAIKVMIKC